MLTLRKLSTLSDGTRRRKTVILIRDFERELISGNTIDISYLRGLLKQLSEDDFWPASIRDNRVRSVLTGTEILRNLNSLRHEMLLALGRDWADWDIETPGDENTADISSISTLPIRVFLDGLRSPFNVGSIMRTALAFGVERLWFSPEGASPEHRRARRSAMGAADRLKWDVQILEELTDTVTGKIIALELGGVDLADFQFPESGTLIIGSEELGVSPEALHRAENSGGVVSIHLPGPKASLNAAVAFGILLRQWVQTLNQCR